MSKVHIAVRIANEQGISREKAMRVLDQLAEMAYSHAHEGFTLPGIGKLTVTNHRARKRRDPSTGSLVEMPPRKVVKFRVSRGARTPTKRRPTR